jgi:NADH:ubiquinone oxidoreductase subunit K
MLERLLIISALLFCIGLYGVLSRRHLIAVIMSTEIMFNAVNVALVAFSRYTTPAVFRFDGQPDTERLLLTGQTFALFVIVVAAAEVALGLALVIALARRRDTVHISDLNLMRR